MSSAFSSGSQPTSSTAKSRSSTSKNDSKQHNDATSSRPFTDEQKAAVVRVRKCSPTAFYDILGLESVKSSCSETEIKKAYRKLSLLTHPDKNGYEGAEGAFKMVSRAFQILSDPDKKSKFDRFGGDPDNRFGGGGGDGGGASPFAGFASRSASNSGRGGQMFEEEISPEEMFRQFFGGGMGGMFGGGGPFGGGLFDTGPGFVFNLGGGGPGVRLHQFGGARPRQRPANAQPAAAEGPASPFTILRALLPIILLFVFPIISSLLSNIFDSSTSSASSRTEFRFDTPVPPLTLSRTSSRFGVQYYVDPNYIKDLTSRQLNGLDDRAEKRYEYILRYECEVEQDERQKVVNQAAGFFWNDERLMDKARGMEMRACKRLTSMGVRY